MGKILHIHIGQAGVQIGNAFWELYCLEHGIDPDGKIQPKENTSEEIYPEVCFEETSDGTFRPRALFIDSEPTIIDQARTGTLEDMLKPDQFINGKEDAGSNFARGYYGQGRKIIDICRERINKIIEKCDGFSGFVIFHSAGGGTGSGLGSLLFEKLSSDHKKKLFFSFDLFSSQQFSSSLIEPYNSVLSLHRLLEFSDSSIVFENEAVNNICKNQLEIESPTFANLNRVIAQAISSISISNFSRKNDFDYDYYQSNIPYPRIHFLLSSYVPLISSENQSDWEFSVKDLVETAYGTSCAMVNCDPHIGKYMSCFISFRGDIVAQEANRAIAYLKTLNIVRFIDWCPTGFKANLIRRLPMHFPGSGIAQVNKAICTVSNCTSIITLFSKFRKQFSSMFAKKAFLHWYTQEGMEEKELLEAKENLLELEKDYEEVAIDTPEDEGEEDI